MLAPHPGLRFWLCTLPTDMRKSFDGLAALVSTRLRFDPADGQVFIFINRKRTLMKCLYFEEGGFCLWCKRLEQGQFASLSSTTDDTDRDVGKMCLTQTEFSALVEGFELVIKKRHKRYRNMP